MTWFMDFFSMLCICCTDRGCSKPIPIPPPYALIIFEEEEAERAWRQALADEVERVYNETH